MIDFACKQFDIEAIIKCALGLSKADCKLLRHFMANQSKECTTQELSNGLKLNLTTIQKGVKKLNEKEIIQRQQKNLSGGGYTFVYKSSPKRQVRGVIKEIIHKWVQKVDVSIDRW